MRGRPSGNGSQPDAATEPTPATARGDVSNERNVVLVTIDSLRADHCLPALGAGDLAPTIARLAADGVSYERAIAPGPRTPSAMPTLFTGTYIDPVVDEDGDYWDRRRRNIHRHLRRYRTIAERFQSRGYTTIGVTVNPWTHDTGFDRGFETFVEINGDTLTDYGPPTFKAVDRLLNGTAIGRKLYWFNKREWFIRWRDFYGQIHDELASASRPYFLWVFLLDTHQPYIVARRDRKEGSALSMYLAAATELQSRTGDVPDWIDRRLQAAYRNAVRSVDQFVARLLEDTAEDDPAVVVHADHGEAFGEHGTYGHEQQFYRENIHVPCIVNDGTTDAQVPEPLSLHRLPDIVTDLATQGAFHPNRYTTNHVVSAVDDGRAHAVVNPDWKYVRSDSDRTLYDLRADPDERTNRVAEFPAVAREMDRRLRRHELDRTERATIARATGGLTNV